MMVDAGAADSTPSATTATPQQGLVTESNHPNWPIWSSLARAKLCAMPHINKAKSCKHRIYREAQTNVRTRKMQQAHCKGSAGRLPLRQAAGVNTSSFSSKCSRGTHPAQPLDEQVHQLNQQFPTRQLLTLKSDCSAPVPVTQVSSFQPKHPPTAGEGQDTKSAFN
jgi:hypothetical protein